MKSRIVLYRPHDIRDPKGRGTQRAIMNANDYVHQARLGVTMMVMVSNRLGRAHDEAHMLIDGEWKKLGRFTESRHIPLVVRSVYEMILRSEDAYNGIY